MNIILLCCATYMSRPRGAGSTCFCGQQSNVQMGIDQYALQKNPVTITTTHFNDKTLHCDIWQLYLWR